MTHTKRKLRVKRADQWRGFRGRLKLERRRIDSRLLLLVRAIASRMNEGSPTLRVLP